MSVFQDLLDLYSDHSGREIEAGGALLLAKFGKQDPQELLGLEGYHEAFAIVSPAAATVETLVQRYPAPADQMRESLRLLRRMIDDGEPATKVDATRRLVEARLYATWPEPVQQSYDRKKEMLEWRDFFVSYTRRDAPSINYQFRDLIRSALGVVPRGPQNQANYVAKVITRHLRRYQGLSGFFDEETLQVGDDLQRQVERFCTRTFAFVQLVEPLSFDREPPDNWCYFEFDRFTNGTCINDLVGQMDRHFFLLTAADIQSLRPANPFVRFVPWLTRIENVIQEHVPLANQRNVVLQAKIQKISNRIVALRAEILDIWLNEP